MVSWAFNNVIKSSKIIISRFHSNKLIKSHSTNNCLILIGIPIYIDIHVYVLARLFFGYYKISNKATIGVPGLIL